MKEQPMASAGFTKPWMAPSEAALVKKYIEELGNVRAFEWGMGGSTVYFPSMPEVEMWFSIEHNEALFKQVIFAVNDKVTPILRPVNHPNHAEGDRAKFKDYINWPVENLTKGLINFVLIDGYCRMECAAAIHPMLADNHYVVLHDAFNLDDPGPAGYRRNYAQMLSMYELVDSFTDSLQTIAIYQAK